MAGIKAFVSPQTWVVVFAIHVLSEAILMVHLIMVLSYLSSLTNDRAELAQYTAYFEIVKHLFNFAFFATVLGISTLWEMTTISTAIVSQMLTFGACGLLYVYSWGYLFGPGPSPQRLPEGKSLLEASITTLQGTMERILFVSTHNQSSVSSYKILPEEQVPLSAAQVLLRAHADDENHLPTSEQQAKLLKQLRRFMLSLAFAPEQGNGVFLYIMITFLSQQLNMNGSQIGFAVAISMLTSIPGSLVSKQICHRFGSWASFRGSLFSLGTTIALFAGAVTGPEQYKLSYWFSGLIGFG
jgi:hypothetical protein